MVNAWSLLYEELNGTMDETYPIREDVPSELWGKRVENKEEKMSDRLGEDVYEDLLPKGWEQPVAAEYVRDPVGYGGSDVVIFGDYSPVSTASSVVTAATQKDWQDFWKDDGISITGNPESFMTTDYDEGTLNIGYQYGSPGNDTLNITGSRLPGGMGEDHISLSPFPNYSSAYEVDLDQKPKPNLEGPGHRKYEEDKGIKDLSDYVSSTYQGHYTNEKSDVQTLDLIHSVGDAESFCRSNAIKYLSRYDKKGQAKRDILKAMHYCLLLYYFSGNTNDEITTRGYETF